MMFKSSIQLRCPEEALLAPSNENKPISALLKTVPKTHAGNNREEFSW